MEAVITREGAALTSQIGGIYMAEALHSNESCSVYERDPRAVADLRDALRGLQKYGVTFAEISAETGVHRSTISTFVNNGEMTTFSNLDKLRTYAEKKKSTLAPQAVETALVQGEQEIGLWQTSEYVAAMGWMRYVWAHRKMGVLIGAPGAGKTTILRNFVKEVPGAVYIEAMPNMRCKDLFNAIADGAGITLGRGNAYERFAALLNGLRGRSDVMILIDEAEYLHKWDADKFEYLRKIWDNTGTPVVLCGTKALELILTRGAGRQNLAQLYRRKYELQLKGITAKAAMTHLRQYNLTTDAAEMLSKIGSDFEHGGLGNLVEILELCLEAAAGGQIDADMVRSAKRHKMMF